LKRHTANRYEYRVFAGDLSAVEEAMAARGRLIGDETTSELYLVTRLNIDANVKIRDAALELKTLKARERLLELWEPALSEELPVPAAVVTDSIAPALGVVLDLGGAREVDAADIVELGRKHPQLAAVPVEKSRRKFGFKKGLGEIVDVRIGYHDVVRSAAVESEVIEVANALSNALRLTQFENIPYTSLLQQWAFR